MMDLNSGWKIKCEDLNANFCRFDEGDVLEAALPCDVHMPLIEKGIIKEPLELDNAFKCEWTENKSWWFFKEFNITEDFRDYDVAELNLEGLDCEADIYLNNKIIGHHKSTFFPFVKNIKEQLKAGENTLLVRLSSGLENYDGLNPKNLKSCVGMENFQNRGDQRRIFARKPQYVFGWDWNPRVPSCAIENAYIEFHNKLAFRNMAVYTKSIKKEVVIGIEAEIQNFDIYATVDAVLNIEIYDGDRLVNSLNSDMQIKSGTQIYDYELIIDNAELWWPNGMGEQKLYHIKAYLRHENKNINFKEFDFGVKTVEICTDKINEKEREFSFMVNGVKMFCKGANWIPADSIYTRVTSEKIKTLIADARNANFNMLRVWGGGLYERECFYEECDKNGILVWQDFMFACALYPDFEDEFAGLVEKEIDYQTKRLRRHVSIAVFCGSNENHEGAANCWRDSYFGGARIYNDIAPRIVHNNCRYIPYWNSSPYGGDNPICNEAGDKHHWHECTMNDDMNKRITPEEYDNVTAKFVSEFGYIGPCRKSSIHKYYGNKSFDVNDDIWRMHNNTWEKDTVLAGVAKHYADIQKEEIDKYLLYAGLCQGLMYFYSLQTFRIKEHCSGGLFWMYNDCWGENGWSIIDYYLNKKPSYYFVKRAFENKLLALRCEDDEIVAYGVNDTGADAEFNLEFGYMKFDGKNKINQNKQVCIKAYSRTELVRFKNDNYDMQTGIAYACADDSDIRFAVLHAVPFRQMKLCKADVKVYDITNDSFKVKSNIYAHAVHFDLEEDTDLSDEYFDLLPNQEYSVKIYNKGRNTDTDNIRALSVYNAESE